ncbi:hypothetical protein SNE40_015389 [Patella caerulea]|uniref:Uncharacterized protein n=1 Tax=Patella caerulea TaxID=87958 RepID=A0AAN8PV45_PATCE
MVSGIIRGSSKVKHIHLQSRYPLGNGRGFNREQDARWAKHTLPLLGYPLGTGREFNKEHAYPAYVTTPICTNSSLGHGSGLIQKKTLWTKTRALCYNPATQTLLHSA